MRLAGADHLLTASEGHRTSPPIAPTYFTMSNSLPDSSRMSSGRTHSHREVYSCRLLPTQASLECPDAVATA
jgi:hypothetical protein